MSTESSALGSTSAPPKRRLRTLLLVVVPLVVAVAAGWMWLASGRWVSTDNAYVGAQKVLITPEVSGRVVSISVVEGARVASGDVLLAVDPVPYRLALDEAEARLNAAAAEHASLVATVASLTKQIDLAKETADLRGVDFERKSALAASRSASQSDVDVARIASVAARTAVEQLEQARRSAVNQLVGRTDLPLADFPAYAVAQAEVAKARRNLEETVIRAPLAGIATQVASIQMGRWVAAGDAIFAVVGSDRVWVDANPKETDLTWVKPGQPVDVTVDAYPDRALRGRVAAISPGTGSQFSILPAQNASGNWVKVVQRVPIRIEFDGDEALADLRSGMSATVAIDTGHRRSLGDLFGHRDARAERPERTGVATAGSAAPTATAR
ncbi:HlyD family secretion protein [Siculibacillus lacustris]|nr:HlyD family secretion protein [Siculibacillus lacustris]